MIPVHGSSERFNREEREQTALASRQQLAPVVTKALDTWDRKWRLALCDK